MGVSDRETLLAAVEGIFMDDMESANEGLSSAVADCLTSIVNVVTIEVLVVVLEQDNPARTSANPAVGKTFCTIAVSVTATVTV